MITAGSDHKVAAGLRRRGERGSITDMNRSSAADSGKSLDDQMARSHDPAMDAQTEITLLYRIDPARNMARFYRLSIQPTLFGSSSLVRNWGRIGTRGRQMIEFYDKPEEAAAASRHMVLRKLNRGYQHERARCDAQGIVTSTGAKTAQGGFMERALPTE
jgi:predicted DNA-binding WGR domain protein